MSEQLQKLTAAQRQRLADLEQIVRECAPNTVRFFETIALIHSDGLYLETHTSFKAYCEETHPVPFRTIKHAIQSMAIRKELLDQGPSLAPSSKAAVEQFAKEGSATAVREIAKTKPEKRPAVIVAAKAIVGEKPVSAKAILEAKAKLAHRPAPVAPEPTAFERLYGLADPALQATPASNGPPAIPGNPISIEALRARIAQANTPASAKVFFGLIPVTGTHYDAQTNQFVQS